MFAKETHLLYLALAKTLEFVLRTNTAHELSNRAARGAEVLTKKGCCCFSVLSVFHVVLST